MFLAVGGGSPDEHNILGFLFLFFFKSFPIITIQYLKFIVV